MGVICLQIQSTLGTFCKNSFTSISVYKPAFTLQQSKAFLYLYGLGFDVTILPVDTTQDLR
uniref:Uncharacterized protein n=1 Tax=Buteo japonicus TaxID=224669 RepID=A0A8C0AXI7_9AVES